MSERDRHREQESYIYLPEANPPQADQCAEWTDQFEDHKLAGRYEIFFFSFLITCLFVLVVLVWFVFYLKQTSGILHKKRRRKKHSRASAMRLVALQS